MTKISRTDCLRRLCKAHDIIEEIRVRYGKLYASVTSAGTTIGDGQPKTPNPKRFEGILVQMADLEIYASSLLEKRAAFDLFACELSPTYMRLLVLRCEHDFTWTEIASELSISESSAKRIFRQICDNAEEEGLLEF